MPLERYLGPDMKIVGASSLFRNAGIECERMEVSLSGSFRPAEEGFLYSSRLDDQTELHLIYMLPEQDVQSELGVCVIRFQPIFFQQYPAEMLRFLPLPKTGSVSESTFPVCSISTALITQLYEAEAAMPFLRSLKQQETALQLLRRALECVRMPFTVCQVPACRFLALESEREKIDAAIDVLKLHLDQPLTIPELARKVAMNECYLKKGFKSVTGKTIHEFHQQLRLEKAKDLLGREGRSVTEVAQILGYSSISHFSTAFKRTTGLRPCELLG